MKRSSLTFGPASPRDAKTSRLENNVGAAKRPPPATLSSLPTPVLGRILSLLGPVDLASTVDSGLVAEHAGRHGKAPGAALDELLHRRDPETVAFALLLVTDPEVRVGYLSRCRCDVRAAEVMVHMLLAPQNNVAPKELYEVAMAAIEARSDPEDGGDLDDVVGCFWDVLSDEYERSADMASEDDKRAMRARVTDTICNFGRYLMDIKYRAGAFAADADDEASEADTVVEDGEIAAQDAGEITAEDMEIEQ